MCRRSNASVDDRPDVSIPEDPFSSDKLRFLAYFAAPIEVSAAPSTLTTQSGPKVEGLKHINEQKESGNRDMVVNQ